MSQWQWRQWIISTRCYKYERQQREATTHIRTSELMKLVVLHGRLKFFYSNMPSFMFLWWIYLIAINLINQMILVIIVPENRWSLYFCNRKLIVVTVWYLTWGVEQFMERSWKEMEDWQLSRVIGLSIVSIVHNLLYNRHCHYWVKFRVTILQGCYLWKNMTFWRASLSGYTYFRMQ